MWDSRREEKGEAGSREPPRWEMAGPRRCQRRVERHRQGTRSRTRQTQGGKVRVGKPRKEKAAQLSGGQRSTEEGESLPKAGQLSSPQMHREVMEED